MDKFTQKGKTIIVLRFSSMGDVAISASFLKEFAEHYPDMRIVMVSRELFRPFFADIPNVYFHPIYPKTDHKGVRGLYRLFKELKGYKPIAIADLHENIRSRIVASFFRLTGVKIRRIDKGRAEKRALTRAEHKILIPLRPTIERYADVFRQLGYPITLSHKLKVIRKTLPVPLEGSFTAKRINIGISPFAQYAYKMYPLDKLFELLKLLYQKGYGLFIFGGGQEQKELAQNWCERLPGILNLIDTYSLTEELAIMSHLDLMISVDSSGMHMASLTGVPVISVWGPTHPFAGFLGYGQLMEDCVQVDHPARPNSVYGNKPCLCGETPCMELITPQMIFDQVARRLRNK